MPIYKRCSRCGSRIGIGETCQCMKQRHREYNQSRGDDKETGYYWSDEWEVVRRGAIARCNGLDLYSLYILGVIENGYTVHHIISIKEDYDRRSDPDNLVYLTESNHQAIHKRMNESKEAKQEVILLLIELNKRYKLEGGGVIENVLKPSDTNADSECITQNSK